MRTFVTSFAAPVIAAALVYILLGQLKVGTAYRNFICVGLVLAAWIALWLVEQKKEESEPHQRRTQRFIAAGFSVALLTILLLIFFNRNQQEASETPSTSRGPAAMATGSPAGAPSNSLKPTQTVELVPDPSPAKPEQSDDWLLRSLKTLPKSDKPSLTWVVLVFDSRGEDHPAFRSDLQKALSAKGFATPAILKDPSKAMIDSWATAPSRLAEIKPYCRGLILAQIDSQTAESDSLSGMITTHLKADVKIVWSASGHMKELFAEADGAGVTTSESHTNAERRAADRIREEIRSIDFD